MSLTMARSERARSLLTHANRMKISLYYFHGERVSNVRQLVSKFTLIVIINFTNFLLKFTLLK